MFLFRIWAPVVNVFSAPRKAVAQFGGVFLTCAPRKAIFACPNAI
jgi:hypothetical protein